MGLAGGHAKPPPATRQGNMGRMWGEGTERETDGRPRARPPNWYGPGFVALIALIALLLLASPAASAAPIRSHQSTSSVALPAATIPATQINLNLSESGSSYYPEYFTLNNTSTVYRLPYVLTSRFSWVTVLNTSRPEGNFHSINYAQTTSANDSGTVVAPISQTGFEAHGGDAYWVDYTYWTYTIYGISAPTLNQNGFNAQGSFEAVFGHYPGHTSGPANFTFQLNGTTSYDLKVSSNLTVELLAPSTVSLAGGCTAFGAHCVTLVWDFESWNSGSTVESSATSLDLGGAGLPVTPAAYQNYSAVYHDPINETGTSGTGGAFIAAGISAFNLVFLQFWYVWILLVVVLLGYAFGRDKRSSRRRR